MGEMEEFISSMHESKDELDSKRDTAKDLVVELEEDN